MSFSCSYLLTVLPVFVVASDFLFCTGCIPVEIVLLASVLLLRSLSINTIGDFYAVSDMFEQVLQDIIA